MPRSFQSALGRASLLPGHEPMLGGLVNDTDALASLGVDDITDDTTTNRTLTVNGGADSSAINAVGDTDWFRVDLVAGQSYAFSLSGSGGQPLQDPFLQLRNASGSLVSIDDDGGDGLSSLMHFTATQTGTYYLEVSGLGSAAVGEYTIEAVTGPPQNPLDTLDLGFTFDTSNIVVYFATTGQNLGPEGPAARSFTASEQAAVMSALQTIADVTNLTFTTTTNVAQADFVFSLDNLETGVLGVTYPTSSSAYIVFSQSAPGWNAAGLMPGGLGYSVIIHEVGHALGLDHPHYDGLDNQIMQGVLSEFGSYGTFGLNQQVFTVMSYNDGWVGPNGLWPATPSDAYGYSATPMALDIAYLQMLYGADPTRNSGDTVYTLVPYQSPNPSYQSIWDVGGIDTIAANAVGGAYIDLNAATLLNEGGGGGFVSYTYDINVYGGFTIAHGVIIENATGAGGNDTLIGNGVDNVLTGNGGDDTLRAGAGADTLIGGDGADVLDGGTDVDSLSGGDGADRLDGGQGADVMTGGAGNDTYFVDNLNDAVVELSDGGIDTVNSAISFVLTAQLENLNLIGSAGNATGNDLANTIIGNSGANTILGGGGDDIIAGVEGDDHVDAGDGDDLVLARRQTFAGSESNVYVGGAGFDTIDFTQSTGSLTINLSSGTVTGGGVSGTDTISGFERVIGSTYADVITGDSFDNVFFGPQGDDIIDGGAGIDTVEFLSFGAVDLVAGTGYSNGSFVTLSNVENAINVAQALGNGANNVFSGTLGEDLLEGGDGADTLSGLAGMDVLRGGNGDDLLIGGQNPDQLEGGAGFDTVSYHTAAAGVVSDLLGGPQTGDAINDSYSSIEAVIGSAYDDTLRGDNAANTLDGGAGADTLIGRGGDDIYVVDNVGDIVTELNDEGTDLVRILITYQIGANIENLALVGSAGITGYGNELSNVITGNGANNFLFGFDGADVLNGDAGADQMFGGLGDDIYYVDNAGDVTSEASALGGVDIVYSSINRQLTANIENLTLTGAAAIGYGNIIGNTIVGNAAANTLYGFEGNDRLDGGAGVDTMFGAAGDDTYVVDSVNDITVEGIAGVGGGVDTIESSVDRGLNANIENLILTGTAVIGYGNVLDNLMTGNASANSLFGFDGNDTLNGGVGADQMFGGNGNDTYYVDNAGDVTSEASAGGGIDTVISSVARTLTANVENLTLTGGANITGSGNVLDNVIIGNAGANTLYGLDGADTLDGGLGADTLQGGAGADTYVFSTALGSGNVDVIFGFNVADDTIQLNNAVFAGLSAGALAAGAFVIGAAASDADDRIIYNNSTGQLFFDADGNDVGAALLFATLSPGLALTSADFIVGGP